MCIWIINVGDKFAFQCWGKLHHHQQHRFQNKPVVERQHTETEHHLDNNGVVAYIYNSKRSRNRFVLRWGGLAALTVELLSVGYDGGYWPPRFCQDHRLRSLICYDAEDPSPRSPLWLSVIKTSRLCCGDTSPCLISCCLHASVKNLHL